MDDTELLDLIATAIVDGTDMDCTARDQAESVLRALREEGVLRAEREADIPLHELWSDAAYLAHRVAQGSLLPDEFAEFIRAKIEAALTPPTPEEPQ